jgi:hypothetical protein
MGDLKSSWLKTNNFILCKYVPYGPTDKLMPYLARRAVETFGLEAALKK